jgi:cold shock CspA family protein/ribosome-associated translation inhibitor RaiA
MQFPPEIAFRGFEPDEWLKEIVRSEVERLDDYFERIVGCRVMVELPHQRREDGNPYHVRIELSVPGRNLVVNRSPKARERERETQMSALDDAFGAMRRRLEDYARELRGDVKRKPEPAHGRVWRLYPGGAPGERYGFIRTPDGSDIYFHENSLLGPGFDQVEVGSEVRFHEEQGDEGPQATTVRVLDRPPAGADGGKGAPPVASGGPSNGDGPGDDAEARGEPLSVENADLLLDELEEALAGLSDDTRNPELIERTEMLLGSLDAFPGPPALLRDPVADLRAWTRILLDDDGNGRHPGPGGPAEVVEHHVFRIREVLEREETLSA